MLHNGGFGIPRLTTVPNSLRTNSVTSLLVKIHAVTSFLVKKHMNWIFELSRNFDDLLRNWEIITQITEKFQFSTVNKFWIIALFCQSLFENICCGKKWEAAKIVDSSELFLQHGDKKRFDLMCYTWLYDKVNDTIL